ncbi:hypothetical protein [Poseidonibacter ostreae]|uniref:Uncharacterized protein n=1 Tax=Poseidonibacter ostreae TaxID=2654171 RepID=A0A6L4WSH4_9BACT|nr:hypothetical protein [Poseidonibacter ostreae]KAB7887416.1 hypothetical protein GBG19_10685 [Poseidonibacter ostreae]
MVYAQSFVAAFVAFSTLGLEGVLVRELTKNKLRTDEILGTGFASVVAIILALMIEDKTATVVTNLSKCKSRF